MFRQIPDLPRGVFGIEAGGHINRDEVDEVMNVFDATISEGYNAALLIECHPGTVDDRGVDGHRFYNRLSARGRTQRFAFVADRQWRAQFDDLTRFLGCEVRMFSPGQRDLALAWLLEAPFLK